MKTITLTSILFIVLALAAIMLAGCYSGSYGDPIDPACDPDVPVVLNGDTIPEYRIERNDEGCVIRIDLGYMYISDPDCISGIEIYYTLERLYLDWNQLTSIDLSPLSSCANLKVLNIANNEFTSIDLSPLASCINLWYLSLWSNQLTNMDLTSLWDLNSLAHLRLQHNNLDSASCAHVCDFIAQHPDCDVYTDCDCP